MSETQQMSQKRVAAAGLKVNGALPLYGDPRPVHSITDRDVAVHAGPGSFAFARNAPMVRLTVDEFERAALDYPIIFLGADPQPYAVSGLEASRNLFVADDGYRPDAYVPAYLRRYPFVFARDDNNGALVLCLDHGSDRVTKVGAQGAAALFDGDEPSALTRRALKFCEDYEAAEGRTRSLVGLLTQLDLFEAKQVHYTPPGAATASLLLEYRTIDRARLDKLGSKAFIRLRDAGALPAIFAQIASQAKWEALAASRRAGNEPVGNAI